MNKDFYKKLNINCTKEDELEKALEEIVKGIKKPDLDAAKGMQDRLDGKIKPLVSFSLARFFRTILLLLLYIEGIIIHMYQFSIKENAIFFRKYLKKSFKKLKISIAFLINL